MTEGQWQERASWKARVEASAVARAAVLPMRVRTFSRVQGRTFRQGARWLARSREHGNFTYDLTPVNMRHLEWWVANVTGSPIDEIRGYVRELVEDDELRDHLREARKGDPAWRLADEEPRYGRRVGWYALVRALKPAHVVETGTDKGLGSMVFAAAVTRNGMGRVTTIDPREEAGALIGGPWADVLDFKVGDSHAVIPQLGSVDFFLHDSLHTDYHERREFELVAPLLTSDAVVLSDTAHYSDNLLWWADQTGRRYSYFQERPQDHWYPGAGIGLSQP